MLGISSTVVGEEERFREGQCGYISKTRDSGWNNSNDEKRIELDMPPAVQTV